MTHWIYSREAKRDAFSAVDETCPAMDALAERTIAELTSDDEPPTQRDIRDAIERMAEDAKGLTTSLRNAWIDSLSEKLQEISGLQDTIDRLEREARRLVTAAD